MTNEDISKIKSFLFKSKNVVIVPHKGPDGDAIGSSLAIFHLLKNEGINTTVISPNEFPDFLKWMPGSEEILIYEKNESEADTIISTADVVFTLDFNHLSRTGIMEPVLKRATSTAKFILIDHHEQPDDYAHFMYSDVSICSTCQMVFQFFDKMDLAEKITPEMATCIYTGIMTDTGSFKYRSTTGETHHIIAQLIEKGADNTTIHENIYDTNSYERLQLLGRTLSNLKVINELNVAYTTLTQEELNQFNFKKGDTEGFVNYGLSLEGIIFAAIFIENESEGIVKISFRSKGDFSVNDFARNHFDGGGHINAAGGKSQLNMQQTLEKFISLLPQYQEELIK
ncbi:MAG TPA: bifunctional oligoribonuclease/PAP phosphatase NrnA [Salinimicrobium sp.]|nr:bifunctional oligoribonuclease/PAP phosphatase NrnA [Salinimicrobium sp.]